MPDPLLLDRLREATQRLVRSVDAMSDADWRAPSLLPDLSRAHVVAHLVLNAEGITGALTGLTRGEPTPMYVSPEARDDDIAELSTAAVHPVRDRLLGSTGALVQALGAVPEAAWGQQVERVPGGATFPAAALPAMRWREVEIHHADLDVGYTRADWSPELADHLLESMTAGRDEPSGFRVHAVDLDRTRDLGDLASGAPTVSGTAADLGWWLSGRGEGEGLIVDRGDLPQIGAW